jgi:hypothetical protein
MALEDFLPLVYVIVGAIAGALPTYFLQRRNLVYERFKLETIDGHKKLLELMLSLYIAMVNFKLGHIINDLAREHLEKDEDIPQEVSDEIIAFIPSKIRDDFTQQICEGKEINFDNLLINIVAEVEYKFHDLHEEYIKCVAIYRLFLEQETISKIGEFIEEITKPDDKPMKNKGELDDWIESMNDKRDEVVEYLRMKTQKVKI